MNDYDGLSIEEAEKLLKEKLEKIKEESYMHKHKMDMAWIDLEHQCKIEALKKDKDRWDSNYFAVSFILFMTILYLVFTIAKSLIWG